MAYSELIKSFGRIRDYMREFFVYGFKGRGECGPGSPRSYDNERRRIESWLSDYMSFRQEAGGKSVFLSVDSREMRRNPLYNAFKAKSFTVGDITLHFYLLDLLQEGEALSVKELMERITGDYLSAFEAPPLPDESTLRKKLREYESLGLLTSERMGRELLYRRSEGPRELSGWRDAAAFFSEADPLGVVGSYLLDKLSDPPEYFGFKHHYILHALDSEILCRLLLCIGEGRRAKLSIRSLRRGCRRTLSVAPLRIYVSAQNGRRYLLAYHHPLRKLVLSRLDSIEAVKPGAPEPEFQRYRECAKRFGENLWGVSAGMDFSMDHIELLIRAGKGEEHIPQRLEREKRCGRVESAGEGLWRFTADVWDAAELVPWLRTFIGRIVSLDCSNGRVTETFMEDLRELERMYGGDEDAVQ